MGPIHDERGFKQGGSELYKFFNNIQLEIAQESLLWVYLGAADPIIISPIGQADDVAQVSNDIYTLQSLVVRDTM